jgi:hypothetical protein
MIFDLSHLKDEFKIILWNNQGNNTILEDPIFNDDNISGFLFAIDMGRFKITIFKTLKFNSLCYHILVTDDDFPMVRKTNINVTDIVNDINNQVTFCKKLHKLKSFL